MKNLDVALEIARLHKMTPKEIYEQRISWIQGAGKLSDPMPTREYVVRLLAEHGIVDPEPGATTDSRMDNVDGAASTRKA